MTMRADTKIEGAAAAGAAVGALTPEQLAIVQTRAAFVPPRWREKFFSAVGDQLALTKSPTNREVLDACAAARRVLAVGIGVPFRHSMADVSPLACFRTSSPTRLPG